MLFARLVRSENRMFVGRIDWVICSRGEVARGLDLRVIDRDGGVFGMSALGDSRDYRQSQGDKRQDQRYSRETATPFDDDDLLAWQDWAARAMRQGGSTRSVRGRSINSGAGRFFKFRFPIEIVVDQHCCRAQRMKRNR
jgi:hypothetical protein